MILVLPAEMPVISPVEELMVATPVLLDVQDTVLLVAFDGVIVGVKVVVDPTFKDAVEASDTPVTATEELETVILHVAVTLAE